MRAIVLDRDGISVRTVADPATPESGVVLEVIAAGLCHSDLTVATRDPDSHPFELPLVLGHEISGRIIEMGSPVSNVKIGDLVAVHGPLGCGRCRQCRSGWDNYCPQAPLLGMRPHGLGRPGGLADYVAIEDARSLIPLSGLDPEQAAPLTDAGLTAYHAVAPYMERLTADDTCVIAGIGGLGHLALQMLANSSPARIIAVDRDSQRLDWAVDLGAHHALMASAKTADEIRQLTDGIGASAFIDFVGAQSTLDLAAASIRIHGDVVIVGVGEGRLQASIPTLPLGVNIRTTYWGSSGELQKVLTLARDGQIKVETTAIPLEDVPRAYRRLEQGDTLGRFVALPRM